MAKRENFWITPECLREQISAVEEWIIRLQAIRVLRE